jgi:hypothetical protein
MISGKTIPIFTPPLGQNPRATDGALFHGAFDHTKNILYYPVERFAGDGFVPELIGVGIIVPKVVYNVSLAGLRVSLMGINLYQP